MFREKAESESSKLSHFSPFPKKENSINMVFIISTSSLCVLGPFCYSLSKRVNPWFFHHTENTEKLVWVFCFNVRTCVWTSKVKLCVCTFNVRIYVQYENLCWHVQCEKLCWIWESVLARSMWEIVFMGFLQVDMFCAETRTSNVTMLLCKGREVFFFYADSLNSDEGCKGHCLDQEVRCHNIRRARCSCKWSCRFSTSF